jgi:hypothetical protein
MRKTTSKQNRVFKFFYSKAVLKAAIEVKGCRKHLMASDSNFSASMDGSSDKAPLKCYSCRSQKVRLNDFHNCHTDSLDNMDMKDIETINCTSILCGLTL